MHLDLDRATPTHIVCWEAFMVVRHWELVEARKKEALDRARVRGEELPAELLAEETGLHSSIEADVKNLSEGKTHHVFTLDMSGTSTIRPIMISITHLAKLFKDINLIYSTQILSTRQRLVYTPLRRMGTVWRYAS